MSTLLTVPEVAARWHVSRDTVRTWAKTGQIPAVKLSDSPRAPWRFDPDDIAAYEARHKTRDPLSLTPLAAARARNRNARSHR